MKGGHIGSGPAPDPSALRRDSDRASWTHLPASREGETPAWPLSRAERRELELWKRQWTRPQAVMWEANGQFEEVALYVRALAVAEQHGASVAIRTLVKQQQEALGLSLPGLLRLRWVIGGAQKAQAAQKQTGTDGPSMRERLRAIEGGQS